VAQKAGHPGPDVHFLHQTIHRIRLRNFSAAAAFHTDKIDKVQNQALRLITGAVKTTHIDAMEEYTQIEPLQLRQEQQAIRLHEKLSCLEPDYWSSPAPHR